VNVKAIAHRIFKRIGEDIGDRRGIKHEWCAICPGVMNGEIRPTWQRIVVEEVEREINKPLLAAAPELLEALEALLEQADLGEVDEETKPIVEQARHAIAKAKGEA
jgi:hypothetical protein